mmetsp:Transcript_5863/g.13376  ORF Transcript_5863/g.13376 Transcript_5863/m.13376 type:complete len:90 (-) Transcript_5863:227-496(-)
MVSFFFSSDASPSVAKRLVDENLTTGCGRTKDDENDGVVVSTAMKAEADILVAIAVVIAATTTAVVTALLGRALLLLMLVAMMIMLCNY